MPAGNPEHLKISRLLLSHYLVVFSAISLVLVYTVYGLLLSGTAAANLVIWIIQILPIAVFLPGLSNRHIRTYQWLCFVILVYFIQAVLTVFEADRQLQGILEIFFCVLLFSSAVFYIHTYKK